MQNIEYVGRNLIPVIAYGDAAGLPFETMSADAIYAKYGRVTCLIAAKDNPYFAGEFDPGQWSDDTQLSIAVALGLTKTGDFTLADIAAEHVAAYHDTPQVKLKTTFTPRGWGGSTTQGVERIIAGVDPILAGASNGAGNGVIMKMAPLVIWQSAQNIPHRERIEQYDQLTVMTHNTAVAKVATRVHGDVLYQILRNQPTASELGIIMNAAARVHEQQLGETERHTSSALAYLEACQGIDQSYILDHTDKKGFFVPQTLAMAYGAFLGSSSLSGAVYNAVNLGGDTDSTASIVATMSLFSNKQHTEYPSDFSSVKDFKLLSRISSNFVNAVMKEV